ncbi:helix-turn-helix domain-containing protein [Pedobacter alpinus]|uniref:Helix-turn-helix domain-containing protein n=1 Tax=Pedobacter alpinus TaxID=1590643 RepID=A0ABW5TQE8_9SPHI
MVCPRCILALENGLEVINCNFNEVKLGFVNINRSFPILKIQEMLLSLGFELITTHDQRLVGSIKTKLIELLQVNENLRSEKLSVWLSNELSKDYHYLSNLFSDTEGKTIERYFIKLRVEKVKEFLVYNELNLKEIAFKLGFSSVAHLSAQFKKETGFTTTHFKKLGLNKRLFIDEL